MGNKLIIGIIVGLLLVIAFFMVKNNSIDASGEIIQSEVENLREAKLSIEGMYCQSCSYGVKAQFEELDGVVSADIDYNDASGVVLYDGDKLDAKTIVAASTAYIATVVSDEEIKLNNF